MLERMPILDPPEDEKDFKMTFPPPEPLPRPILAVSDVTFGYDPSKPAIVTKVDFGVDQQSRIGIMGPNGAGKTTLINLLLEKLRPQVGNIRRNPRLRVACFTQHHVDQLQLNKSALDNLKTAFPDSIGDEGEDLVYRKHLGRFGVSGDLATRPCRRLSGGQKSRVAIAMLTWNVPHIMVFDEPTNHLDLETTEALIKALETFGGGVLVVTHDQHFISSVCKELW
jgi:ATP-binding cassette subfamily F protein 3